MYTLITRASLMTGYKARYMDIVDNRCNVTSLVLINIDLDNIMY